MRCGDHRSDRERRPNQAGTVLLQRLSLTRRTGNKGAWKVGFPTKTALSLFDGLFYDVPVGRALPEQRGEWNRSGKAYHACVEEGAGLVASARLANYLELWFHSDGHIQRGDENAVIGIGSELVVAGVTERNLCCGLSTGRG